MSELSDSWYPNSQIRVLVALFWRKEPWLLTFLDTTKHTVTAQVTKDPENVTKTKGLVYCITFMWRT
jgi:hypothetical protein